MPEMKPYWLVSLIRISAVILLACLPAAGRQQDPLAAAGCISGTNYETAGFRIRSVRVHHPFDFLRRIQSLKGLALETTRSLEGAPFRYAAVRQARDELERMTWLPEIAEQRVQISLIVDAVENCTDTELDVVYWIYSSQIAAIPSFTWESRKAEMDSPESAAGFAQAAGTFQLKPVVRYNETDQSGGVSSADSGGGVSEGSFCGRGEVVSWSRRFRRRTWRLGTP
jgi:hypothetical protein